MRERTCGLIMEPFVRALSDRADLPAVQIIGGNGSAALLNEHTVIDLAARTIEAPAVCDLPILRPDGSLRDMDTLVLSTDQEQIDSIQALAEELIGDELKISIFGLKTIADLQRQRGQPLRSTARIFLGDRYVTTSYDERGQVVGIDGFKALYPFRAPITTGTFETFQLSTQGRITTPTAHPGTTILNYLTRSISGVRAKDLAKVRTMTENVLTRCPEVRAWIHDGPGQDMFDLARILQTLRGPRSQPDVLRLATQLEIVPYTLGGLHEHQGFMASSLSPGVQRMIIELSHLKSQILGRFEGNPTVVTFWQKHIEDRLKAIIHNEP
ncbi:MAG: hypothetical protein OEV40_16480 [Acidimicrobiia bacterium]|nr:hypothetical protein [Acidimicrobiia bacterium]